MEDFSPKFLGFLFFDVLDQRRIVLIHKFVIHDSDVLLDELWTHQLLVHLLDILSEIFAERGIKISLSEALNL